MEPHIKQWFGSKGKSFFERTGLREGQVILDLGCSQGRYALPAAEVVGESGKVYAVDKDPDALEKLETAAEERSLKNMKCLRIPGGKGRNPHSSDGTGDIVDQDGNLIPLNVPLPDNSVDVTLLYDVLHGGYFPEAEQRMEILRDIYRVIKPGGLLSFYPTHLKKFGITFKMLLEEVNSLPFQLEHKSRRRLLHDGNLVRGWVFSFRVKGAPEYVNKPEQRQNRRLNNQRGYRQ